MRFFHVYNEDCFKGLEKNGLINKDTGFKIQHVFSMPEHLKFNEFAAKGSKLHRMIKEGGIPFYVDRIAGGVTWHNYAFDKELIREYRELLGDWFLGFQLHESASNRRFSEWPAFIKKMGGKGPYDLEEMKKRLSSNHAIMPDGTVLPSVSQDSLEYYANKTYADTYQEFVEEIREMYSRRMQETDDSIIPCDSYFMATKLQNEMGMRTFMPEVGCQIPLMRLAVAIARGAARGSKKTWGVYYECWREIAGGGYSMPCFNTDSSNEWYLTQKLHPDDFTSHGKNGGSSRLLQNRIYYHALMSGADYFSEEWGLNCSYSNLQDFSLSEYGEVKKSFIKTAETLRGIRAITPFAIVLPTSYRFVELPFVFDPSDANPPNIYDNWDIGAHRCRYLCGSLSAAEQSYFGHVEDVLKLIYGKKEACIGNESHVLTNSRFGDVFDVIYADASADVLGQYDYLIDASPDGAFTKANGSCNILESGSLGKLERELQKKIEEAMPCCAEELHWLVSTDETGRRFLSVFNNEGNERSLVEGDILHAEADRRVKVTFKEAAAPSVLRDAFGNTKLEKADDHTYFVTVTAAGFAIIEF